MMQGFIIGTVDLEIPTDGYSITYPEVADPANVIWIDARRWEAYQEGHHPGAFHLTEDDWDAGLAKILSAWDFSQPLIVYCEGGDCANSKAYAERLRREMDTDDVLWLQGGWQALREGQFK